MQSIILQLHIQLHYKFMNKYLDLEMFCKKYEIKLKGHAFKDGCY